MEFITFKASNNDIGIRLDLFIVINSNKYSRMQVKELINTGNVFINDIIEYRPHYKIRENDSVRVNMFLKEKNDFNGIKPQKIDIEIIYEDENLLIVNKPSGMVTHPATGNWENTLLNGLFYYYKNLKSIGNNIRSGLIHRIDKDTSGIVMIGKTAKGLWYYSKLFANRKIEKTYLAIVVGNIKKVFVNNEIVIKNYLDRNPKNRIKFSIVRDGGRYSESIVKLLKPIGEDKALIEISPKTGRTHQIRVHLSSLGCPILGDTLYGKGNKYKRLMLHAHKIRFINLDGKEMIIEAPIPIEFKGLLND